VTSWKNDHGEELLFVSSKVLCFIFVSVYFLSFTSGCHGQELLLSIGRCYQYLIVNLLNILDVPTFLRVAFLMPMTCKYFIMIFYAPFFFFNN
jgi:hypothetical protein